MRPDGAVLSRLNDANATRILGGGSSRIVGEHRGGGRPMISRGRDGLEGENRGQYKGAQQEADGDRWARWNSMPWHDHSPKLANRSRERSGVRVF